MSGLDRDDREGPREEIAGALSALRGRVVADTREDSRERRFAELLEAVGARVLPTPAMRIVAPADPGPLAAAAADLAGFDWIVLASANAARALMAARGEQGGQAGGARTRVCVVGPGTAEAVEEGGWAVDLVADRHLAEGIVEALRDAGGVEGRRILLPRPAEAPDLLPDELEALGGRVVVVEAYRNVPDEEGLRRLGAAVGKGEVDVVALTAASVARRVARVLGPLDSPVRVAAIGPSTAAAAREAGLTVHAVAEPHSLEGLVEACGRALLGLRGPQGPEARPS